MAILSFKAYSSGKWITIIISTIFLVLSLFFTAFTIKEGEDENVRTILSLEALLSGWYGALIFDVATLSWFANPLWLLAIIYFDKNRKIAFLSILLSMALSISFLFANEIIANEGGGTREISKINAGYYLWFIGQALTFIMLLYQQIKKKIKTRILN